MPPATLPKSSTPINALTSVAANAATTAIQSGPYTKSQFQNTMEGSRTIKSAKEVEQLLRDYPAALELYRTGKYKVKVKCEADVERVILVEKRSPKVLSNNSTTTATATTTINETRENNQAVPDLLSNAEEDKDSNQERTPRQSRSRTHSQDRIAPTTSVTHEGNFVHTTISSIRMTSNTQPKVDHHRTPSNDRELSVTPQQKPNDHRRSHSRDSQNKALYNKKQGNKINREYHKLVVPYVPNANNLGKLWQQQQQQRPHQPYFSNPLLQQQQQQQQQQRTGPYMPSPFMQQQQQPPPPPQQNPLFRQPFYFGQQPAAHAVFPQQFSAYPTSSVSTLGKSGLHSTNNYSLSSQSISNTMGLPPSFRTFHSNQQQLPSFRPMYQSQVPFPMNHPWPNMPNESFTNIMNNRSAYAEHKRGARNRARSVDTGGRSFPPTRLSNVQQQTSTIMEHYHHHHHHHRHRTHPTNHVAPSGVNGREQNVVSKESTPVVTGEKLTVRQLNENFIKEDPSGRLPYSSIPPILQRFGIIITENDATSAAKDLGYNINETISARRLVHILVKLGKITKSTQQHRRPVSPSVLPEDREVTDIMTQNKTTPTHTHSSKQPNQWN